MRKILFGTTALLALAALAALSTQRAAAGPPQVKLPGVPGAGEVGPLLQKAVAKSKDVKITGGLDLAKAIVTEGIAGTPKPERSAGKIFPHYLVTTKKGGTYKVKCKRDTVDGKHVMTITVTKQDGAAAPAGAPPMTPPATPPMN